MQIPNQRKQKKSFAQINTSSTVVTQSRSTRDLNHAKLAQEHLGRKQLTTLYELQHRISTRVGDSIQRIGQ